MTRRHFIELAAILKAHETDPNHCPACAAKRTTLGLLTVDIAGYVRANKSAIQA